MLEFWEEYVTTSKHTKRALSRVPPPIPETGWRPDTTFPNLSAAVALGFDLEVKEYDLEHGPGWARGQSHIVGVAITAFASNGERIRRYYPVRHEIEPEFNIETARVFNYTAETFSRNIPVCGANLIYDVGTAAAEGITITGELHDCQFAEPLLHETGEVNLDFLGLKYLGVGKDANELQKWLTEAYGDRGERWRENIYRCSPRLVGPYAEQDSEIPFDIINKQIPRLQNENLYQLYRMECDLIRLWVRMRFAGVQIDLPYAHKLYGEISGMIDELRTNLRNMTGVDVDATTPTAQVKQVFDAAGIPYPYTAPSKNFPQGQPSFVKEWLAAQTHPAAELIQQIREHEKIRTTFIKSYILENHDTAGKIHGEFHPLRADNDNAKSKSKGTRSGRLSSAHPNLQNIPVRTELGKKIRTAFVADYGHKAFLECDYSQYEYRLLAHFAVGPGSDELRASYCNNPLMDYHDNMQSTIFNKTGKQLERKPVKTINFSLMNEMGERELARRLGLLDKNGKPNEQCIALFQAYHAGAPYVKATSRAAQDEAQALGYVTTILNRRSRFDLWEPREKNWEEPAKPLSYQFALREYGHDIIRAIVHIALNRKLQGSNADGMKMSLWLADRAGVFRVIGDPRITVHDSLGFSQIDDSPPQMQGYSELFHIMETALPLRVPVRVDHKTGANWGECA